VELALGVSRLDYSGRRARSVQSPRAPQGTLPAEELPRQLQTEQFDDLARYNLPFT